MHTPGRHASRARVWASLHHPGCVGWQAGPQTLDGTAQTWHSSRMIPVGQALGVEDESDLAELFSRLEVSREWATGLLVAVLSGPEVLTPSAWLGEIIDDDVFADLEDARAGLGLIMRLYNDVCRRLLSSPEALCPEADDVDGVTEFCGGYLRGVRLHRAWCDDELAMVPVFVLAALAGDVDEEDLRGFDEKPIADPEAWRQRHRDALGEYVAEMYAYWRARPRPAAAPARAKAGRNDPCPCGSGKKRKKCCLQA